MAKSGHLARGGSPYGSNNVPMNFLCFISSLKLLFPQLLKEMTHRLSFAKSLSLPLSSFLTRHSELPRLNSEKFL